MSCGCNKTTLQGKKYCQDCMPDEYHWLVPVSKKPDPFLMDRHHAYIMPNNTIYVLSHDRTQAIDISGNDSDLTPYRTQAIDISGNDSDLTPYALKTELANKITELNQKLTTGLEGAKYYEGEGIRIDEDKRIHSTVNLTEVNERIDAIEQAGNSPYKAGTGIEITPDLTINNTVSTDALETRVQALEEKEDQNTTYTAGTGLQLSGTEFSVDLNDLPVLDQVDDLRDKVTALEGKKDADTKYTAGAGLLLNINNMFSIKAKSYGMGSGFTYTNPFITIGFIDKGQEDVGTGKVTHKVSIPGTSGVVFKHTLVVNPTTLDSYRHYNQITVSSGNATFSFTVSSGIGTYYNPATEGRVLIITELVT